MPVLPTKIPATPNAPLGQVAKRIAAIVIMVASVDVDG